MRTRLFILLLLWLPSLARQGCGEETWRLYAPGEDLPLGKWLAAPQIVDLEDGEYFSEPLYLIGDFKVTASGGNRAVLRSPLAPKLRVVASYPPAIQPPAEGAGLQRPGNRPFHIIKVRRTSDGQVTLYVREVMAPAP